MTAFLYQRSSIMFTCHVLRATCYVLRATCYVLRATCYVLRATCYVLRATCYSPGHQLDFVDARPPLAGDEQAVALRIVGDAVQHVSAWGLAAIEQAGQIDPAGDLAGPGRDAGDSFGLPDVGVD